MRDVKFICCQPDDNYYTWQVHMWLESLRNLNLSHKAIVLIFVPNFREQNKNWQKIINLYPEAEFYFQKDEDNINNLISLYIPIIRPYTLYKYFEKNSQLKNNAIFYCDSDILFTDKFNDTSVLNTLNQNSNNKEVEKTLDYINNKMKYMSYSDSIKFLRGDKK